MLLLVNSFNAQSPRTIPQLYKIASMVSENRLHELVQVQC